MPDAARMKLVDKMLCFVAQVLSDIPSRSIPLLMGDFNEGFGKVRDRMGRPIKNPEDEIVGPYGKAIERAVGTRIRQLCDDFHFQIATTWWPLSASYYGNDGHQSWIDHIIIPREARCLVDKMAMLRSSMRRIQASPSRTPKDHCPIFLRVLAPFDAPEPRALPKIGMDSLMEALLMGMGPPGFRHRAGKKGRRHWRQVQRRPHHRRPLAGHR